MTDFDRIDGVSYSYINTSRFKTTLISVGFYLPLNQNASANTLTLNLMKSGTVSLPDTYSLNRRLASLYGASVSAFSAKNGDCQELRLNITVNDDRYSIDGEATVTEAGLLLNDMIFGRFLNDSYYPEEAIAREKRLLLEQIAGKLNDKRIYAREKCEAIMCEDEPYGLSAEGDLKAVAELTADSVKEALQRMLCEAKISVQVIGAYEPEEFKLAFFNAISTANRRFSLLPDDIVKPAGELKTFEEKMPVKQGKLVLGLRTDKAGLDRATVANWIMGDIFGGGPYSKLFCNVREKMSLCYYCSARSIRRKGLILVDSGVEEANIESAKTAILAELDNMANGNFTDREMNSSKLSLCDAIRSVESDQMALARWYGTRALEENPAAPAEICSLIENLTKEDIIASAKGFKLDTVYTLKPDGTVKEEA